MENPESESGESPAQKQIRLRRERREAKIKAGGSARLEKITSLTGRPPPTAAAAAPVQSGIPFPFPAPTFSFTIRVSFPPSQRETCLDPHLIPDNSTALTRRC